MALLAVAGLAEEAETTPAQMLTAAQAEAVTAVMVAMCPLRLLVNTQALEVQAEAVFVAMAAQLARRAVSAAQAVAVSSVMVANLLLALMYVCPALAEAAFSAMALKPI